MTAAPESAETCPSAEAPVQAPGADRLGYLLARQGRIIYARLREALDGLTLDGASLSPRHGSVLMRLARTGSAGQQTLIEELGIDASTLVTVLNELERGGALARRRDPADRRRHIVEITDAGRCAVREVEQTIAQVEAEAFADLDPAETAQLHALLAKVYPRASEEDECAGA